MPCFTVLQMKLFPEALCEYLTQWFHFGERCNTKDSTPVLLQAKVTSEAPAGSTALGCKQTLSTREPTSKQFCALFSKQRLLCSKGHTCWNPWVGLQVLKENCKHAPLEKSA